MVKSLLAVAWLSGAHRTVAALATGWLRNFDFRRSPRNSENLWPQASARCVHDTIIYTTQAQKYIFISMQDHRSTSDDVGDLC